MAERLVAERYRAALERYRDASARTANGYEAAIREAEARYASERATIERELDELTSMHDRVLAMADAVRADPGVAQFGPIDATPAATVREGSPREALLALHDSVANHIAHVLPYATPKLTGATTEPEAPTDGAGAPARTPDTDAHALDTRTEDDEHAVTHAYQRADHDEDEDEDEANVSRSGCAAFLLLFIILSPFIVMGLDLGSPLVRALPFLCSVPIIDNLEECVMLNRPSPSRPSVTTPRSPSSTATPNTSTTPSTFCASGRWHTVAPAERLSAIALRYQTTVDELVRLNRTLVQDVNLIRPGWRLCLP